MTLIRGRLWACRVIISEPEESKEKCGYVRGSESEGAIRDRFESAWDLDWEVRHGCGLVSRGIVGAIYIRWRKVFEILESYNES